MSAKKPKLLTDVRARIWKQINESEQLVTMLASLLAVGGMPSEEARDAAKGLYLRGLEDGILLTHYNRAIGQSPYDPASLKDLLP